MKTTDFMTPVTVEGLNKELRAKHGITVDIAKYSKEQLEGYAAKIAGKLEEFEINNSYNEHLTNENYQKNSLIKKIVETAINQYVENPLESVDEEDLGEDVVEVDESDADVAKDFADETVEEGAKPDFLDMDKDGNKKEPMKKAIKDKENKKKTDESIVVEGEEDKAAVIMAAKDMVDRFTSFLEDVAEMSAEGLLQIQDQIRDEMGQEQAEQFGGAVAPALESTVDNLKASRDALTGAIGILTGEGAPADTIGAEPETPELDAGDDMDAGVEEPMPDAGDDFGASDAAVGGEEPEGREKRESYTPKKKSIAESNKILSTLSK